MFLPREDGTEGVESAHHPFTAPKPDDLDLVYADPLKVCDRMERALLSEDISGASTQSVELHDQVLVTAYLPPYEVRLFQGM